MGWAFLWQHSQFVVRPDQGFFLVHRVGEEEEGLFGNDPGSAEGLFARVETKPLIS